jgi:3-oxoadipate enol-lactonase
MQVQANGILFNYQIEGAEDGPWLVFSNPLATNLSLWDWQVAELAPHFRILRYDQRGHGSSEAPSGRYTFEMLAEDALALFDVLGVKQPHFVGLSMGAATALAILKNDAKCLGRLVICDCSAASTPQSHKQWEERIAQVEADGMTAVADSLTRRWLSPVAMTAAGPYVPTIRQMIADTPVNGFIGCAAAVGNHNLRDTIGGIASPTLFLVGEHDVSAAGVMQTMHETLSDSSYIVLPEAGHLSNVDQPIAFTRAIKEFLTLT